MFTIHTYFKFQEEFVNLPLVQFYWTGPGFTFAIKSEIVLGSIQQPQRHLILLQTNFRVFSHPLKLEPINNESSFYYFKLTIKVDHFCEQTELRHYSHLKCFVRTDRELQARFNPIFNDLKVNIDVYEVENLDAKGKQRG